MRVPDIGQPLYERRIVREGKRIAERMLAGYSVTANGRFVPERQGRDGLQIWSGGLSRAAEALTGLYRRAARSLK